MTAAPPTSSAGTIAFQGQPGAYSDLACRQARPGWTTLPCATFADAIAAVHDGRAELAMLACENSLAGRVPDIHALLPQAGLYIVGEHFQRVEHCLMGVPGARLSDARRVHTHPVAMAQIRGIIRELDLTPVVEFDTAGAAELVAQWGNPEDVAVASSLAAELNNLTILRRNVEDAAHNTTRFYIASREALRPAPGQADTITTVLFRVRNAAGALYKVLGGFATNGVNMTRLESYMLDGSFAATQFLLDVEGHPDDPALGRALAELAFFSEVSTILGVYPGSPFRRTVEQGTAG
ncbi:prephenate dehydratase [Gluconacetobacter azotocaptans]|uniref:prephenate dehydratase n=1 Tax=Gluconacetobacter azotocaptans TaxID=142834 RepID=A0A7W4JTX5_9PROT|nr:prephenate dehydratase [Gluconacetobacter azotocaptans]MBB2190871.1 prephenate dehydratase [Gluconacetobacter azotocaptans]MBM9401772.1 prephenate dehydratase [Gluconacetobacter azotocaptans]GBQ31609.1 prephenate dehydratase [Gluconacetobacter azotocaptans DSM 13594]